MNEMIPTLIRLPESDREWLRRRAAEEDRNLSSQVRHLIKRARSEQKESTDDHR